MEWLSPVIVYFWAVVAGQIYSGDQNKQRKSLLYLREFLLKLDANYVVLPGHQYELSDGSNPTVLHLVISWLIMKR